jgi:hypothetical protein
MPHNEMFCTFTTKCPMDDIEFINHFDQQDDLSDNIFINPKMREVWIKNHKNQDVGFENHSTQDQEEI